MPTVKNATINKIVNKSVLQLNFNKILIVLNTTKKINNVAESNQIN